MASEATRGNPKSTIGIVVKAKMQKSVIVQVTTLVKHQVYKKYMKSYKKYYVHDEENRAKEGDKVRIIQSKPISKLKRWRLIEVLAK